MLGYLQKKKNSILKEAYYEHKIDKHLKFIEKYWKRQDYVTYIIHCEALINRILTLNLVENIEKSKIWQDGLINDDDTYDLILFDNFSWNLKEHMRATQGNSGKWIKETNLLQLIRENIKFEIIKWTENGNYQILAESLKTGHNSAFNYTQIISNEISLITKKRYRNWSHYLFGKHRIRNEIMHPTFDFFERANDDNYIKEIAEFYQGMLTWILVKSEPSLDFKKVTYIKSENFNSIKDEEKINLNKIKEKNGTILNNKKYNYNRYQKER